MKEQRLPYKFRRLKIFLFILSLPILSWGQETIKVVDENDLPLVGAYVQCIDFKMATDQNGVLVLDYEIPDTFNLMFKFIGYEDLSINMGDLREVNNIVKMVPDLALLDEIIIIGRTDAREFDLPYTISSVKAEEIQSSNVQTSADAIAIKGGAYIQKTQMGGGSPVLRGFEANKILLVVDGVRMNNAIYRNGHLQNAITIDASILQQAEIIFGPGSLMYGSDALGGVVHYRTKSPIINYTDQKRHQLSSYARYNSSNQEKTFHVDHSFSSRKFGVLTSISYSDFSDLKTGSQRDAEYSSFGLRNFYVERINDSDQVITNEDPNVQVGTAYNQMDALQKWVFQPSKDLSMQLNLQYSSSSDIPRYDFLTEIDNGQFQYGEWFYGPQNRLLVSPKIVLTKPSGLFDKFTAIASYQNIKEERNLRLFNDLERETQNEKVQVLGLTVDFEKRITNRQHLSYGADLHFNDVNSTAYSQNINTDQISNDILTRYPSGGSQMKIMGLYLQHRWQNSDSTLNWINGLRLNRQVVDFTYQDSDPLVWPSYFYDGIESSQNAVSGVTGIILKKNRLMGKLTLGTAFRSPNVDDLAKIRVKRDEISVPNPELGSENVLNTELSISYTLDKAKIGITGYYTFLDDAIVRQNSTLPDGSSTFISGGDTLQVTANVNAESGIVKGISTYLNWDITKNLNFYGSYNIQSGTAEDDAGNKSPLSHIPPSYGVALLSYKNQKYELGFTLRFNGWKYIEDFGGSEDNPDLATPEGSPSWQDMGLNAKINLSEGLSVSGALNNILDKHYRPFSSGLSAPGRHFILTLRYSH